MKIPVVPAVPIRYSTILSRVNPTGIVVIAIRKCLFEWEPNSCLGLM
jgi:hypothetical protein